MALRLPPFARLRIAVLPVVLAFVAAAPLAAQEPASSRPSSRPVRGSLAVEKGVRVLRLEGTPREMGYAHGWLLAEEIVPFVDAFVVKLPFVVGVDRYLKRVVPYVAQKMAFSADEEEEIAGMVEGIRAKLGDEGARLPSLGRVLEAIDLKAGNTFGDWAPFACSSFSAWGALTKDGGTITARNFDYFPHPKLEQLALLIARTPADPARRAWVNVGYPGLVGLISGMNEDGVGLFVHDVMPARLPEERGVAPRLLALRRALEGASGPDPVASVFGTLRDTTTHMGNNVQTTSPFDGSTLPAAVVEYDGAEDAHDGADLRGPDGSRPFVLCSNHYRTRAKATRCGRYGKIEKALADALASGEKIDAARARAIMATATQNSIGSRTLHTVVFQPRERRFDLMLAKDGKVAPAQEPTSFTLAELLPRRRP